MAKQKTLHCSVITPEQQVVDADVQGVILPAHDGQVGVLNQRAPMLCEAGIGVLRLQGGEMDGKEFYIDGGFAQVLSNEVTVLTPRAIPAGEVTRKAADEAKQAAEAMKVSDDASATARDRAMTRARTLEKLVRK